MASENETPELIEEKVDSGLLEMLGGYHPKYRPGGDVEDEVAGRFQINTSHVLPALSHELGKAFDASDRSNPERGVYAVVLENYLPYRLKLAEALAATNQTAMQNVYASATVPLSFLGESRQVVVLEKPQGVKLSEYVRTQGAMHEHQVIDRVLQPLVPVLRMIRDKGMAHGSINISNVYLGENLIVGECVTAPCGYFQPFLYEPLERLMADQLCRGMGEHVNDVYAMGVLAFDLIYGLDHLKNMGRDDFIKTALEISTYHLFTGNRDISDNMADFFRGVLHENPAERWDIDQCVQWLGGKRFNMIVPPAPREASRPLQFMGQDYFNRRALANAFHKNWRTTIKELKALRLDRWFEMSLHRPELADRIERVLRLGGDASSEKTNNDMLTRLICSLDPLGPIRTQHLSMRPEGMGILLADLLHRGQPAETKELLEVLELDTTNYWAYLSDGAKSNDFSQLLWRIQRIRPLLKIQAAGFGFERILYELNPNLCCQSALLKPYHVMNLQDLLRTLDALAPELGKDTPLLDRHMVAFAAAKLDLGKEIKLLDLSAIPSLINNQELVAIRILAKAQQRYDKMPLVGLAAWVGVRIEMMLDEIHNRTIRKKLKLKLKSAAVTGSINDVLSILVNREIVSKDYEGFLRAANIFYRNQQQIEQLNSMDAMHKDARKLGGKIAMFLAYTILLGSLYMVVAKLLGW